MLFRLLLLFIMIPLVELYLLLKLGALIGAGPTLAIIIMTGILGGTLARRQGFVVLRRIKEDLQTGILPTEPLIDGLFILAGGLLLLTPGLLTDIVGFLALLPLSRRRLKGWMKRRFQQILDSRAVYADYQVDE
jgi:UPF0716 protein FxsA